MNLRAVAIALVILTTGFAASAQDSGVTMRPQDSSSGTLEIAPQVAPPQVGGQNSPKISVPPPALAPSEPVLVIPRASRDFVGRWGGHIGLTNSFGRINPPADSIVGLQFGERDGQVFLHTVVFADPDANLLKTEAEVLNPREITLMVVGLDISTRPPIRHVEKLRLRLTDKNQMEVAKDVDLYPGGYPHPMAGASYSGTLHIVNDAEQRDLDREVLDRGVLPRATIDEHRPVPAPY